VNEYQKFAADKAKAFIQAMEDIGETNNDISKLLNAMRVSIEKIIDGEEPLPTGILRGWSLYFSPDCSGIYDTYPKLVDAHAELSWILRHASMESYLKSRRYLESL
jgi:hypothetical protein